MLFSDVVRVCPRFPILILCYLFLGCSSTDSASDNDRVGGIPGGWTNGGGPSDSFEAPVSVKATRAVRRSISRYLLSNTSLESIREVTIYARVNALVEDLNVEEGDSVKRNQLLARLKDHEIRNEHDQARIAVDQARLTLEQAKVKSRLSKANYKRSGDLVAQNLISPQEHDQSALTNETDALAVTVAIQQRDAAVSRLEAAQLQLEYTDIRSSIGGTITERLIDIGDRVNLNEALFVVEDFNPLWARIYLPERELSQIRIGQRAELRMQAYPKDTFQGTIKMISPTVDSESGTIKATLEILAHQNLLRPGMFGSVYIATETRSSALVLPTRAIVRERDENRVFVIGNENRVEKREVTIGFREENELEIVSGISEGEAVVTVGQEGLNDGYPVSVLEWEHGEKEAPAKTAPTQQDLAPKARSPGQTRQQQGRGQYGESWSFDPERMKVMLERMAKRNPEIKKAYKIRLAEDPHFLNDPDKSRAFMMKIRSQFSRDRQ